MTTLLLIEDDPQVRTVLRLALEDEDYRVVEAGDGMSGVKAFETGEPDLVLLDLRLPDRPGLEVCRELRRRSIVPIIIVTAQSDSHDLVAGLEAGADDYVVKPVVPKALAARVRALLRRVALHSEPRSSAQHVGHLELRQREGVVLDGDQPLDLTTTEFRLLCEFAAHPNLVLSREQLLERVWGYDYLGDSRLVDAHVSRLRGKVERDPHNPGLIVTVRGMGYKLQP